MLKKGPQMIYPTKGNDEGSTHKKKIVEKNSYFNTLVKEAHKEKEDNPHMAVPCNLTNHTSSQI